jgi:dsDNA-specific endonuclease/ATPase MutS2
LQYPGINWQWSEELDEVLAQLPLGSVYGQRAFRLKFYSSAEEAELVQELEKVQSFYNYFVQRPDLKAPLNSFLQSLPDLKSELESLKNGHSLYAEGFLKIKRFFIALEKDLEILIELSRLQGSEVRVILIEQVLKILDPQSNRLPSFFLDGNFSRELALIRQDKAQLLKSLFQDEENDQIKAELKRKNQEETKEEESIYQELSLQLRVWTEEIEELCQLLGRLDFLQAKAHMAIQFKMVSPQISQTDKLDYMKLRHPLLQWNLQSQHKAYQSLDLKLPLGTSVLTGANMSGKSIALKSLMLNQYLFQTGFFVFAERACLTLFDSLTMIDEIKQSLQKGLSSFAAEIIALQNFIAQNQKSKAFLILDEFARSTNPTEGAALLKAILKKRKKQKGLTIIASHYDEIAQEAEAHWQIIGLSQLDLKALRKQLNSGKDPTLFLQEKMNYSWEISASEKTVPKEARLVAGLLGLDQEIMENFAKEMAKKRKKH